MQFLNKISLVILWSVLGACGADNNPQGGVEDIIVDDSDVQGVEGEARNEARNMNKEFLQGQAIEIHLSEIALPPGATLKLSEDVAHGDLSISNHRVTYQPGSGFVGTDRFSYTLTQSNGKADTYTVTLSIIRLDNSGAPVQVTVNGIADWKGNAKSAYTIIHDDMCGAASPSLENHWNELTERGLVAGFGVIVGGCEKNASTRYYKAMREMQAAGHEILNHSYTHPNLTETAADLNHEFKDSTEILESRLPGTDITFFIFPYDAWDQDGDLFSELQKTGYLGARGGTRGGINLADIDIDNPLTTFEVGFDCYNENRVVGGSCSEYKQGDILKLYLDDAIKEGGWAVRELHGIGDESWGNIPILDYESHLDDVVKRVAANEVWMDTPTNITRYRATRAYCGSAIANDGVIRFDSSLAQSDRCRKFAVPVSILITTTEAPSIIATQNGTSVPVTAIGENRYILDANPTSGAVLIVHP